MVIPKRHRLAYLDLDADLDPRLLGEALRDLLLQDGK